MNYFSSIIITFKETGKMNFLSQDYGFKPDSVFVNDNEREFSNQSMEDLLFYWMKMNLVLKWDGMIHQLLVVICLMEFRK